MKFIAAILKLIRIPFIPVFYFLGPAVIIFGWLDKKPEFILPGVLLIASGIGSKIIISLIDPN